MSEFLSRLLDTGIKIVSHIVAFAVLAVILGAFAALLFVLPMWLLSKVIGDAAFWWMFVVFIGIPLIAEWEKIKGWIYWQFIEPFQK